MFFPNFPKSPKKKSTLCFPLLFSFMFSFASSDSFYDAPFSLCRVVRIKQLFPSDRLECQFTPIEQTWACKCAFLSLAPWFVCTSLVRNCVRHSQIVWTSAGLAKSTGFLSNVNDLTYRMTMSLGLENVHISQQRFLAIPMIIRPW